MRKSLLSAAIVATLLVLWAGAHSIAQSGGAAPLGIAVIDINAIFKEHGRFKSTMENLKKEIQLAEEALKKERNYIQSRIDAAAQFKPGTPNFKQAEEEIADLQAKFNVKAQLKKKNFMERESKIYFNVYTEVTKEVQEIAARYNIKLVLRYNSEPPSDEGRDNILRTLNQPIVYQNGLDITRHVIDSLNNRGGLGAAPSAKGRVGFGNVTR